MPAPVTLRDIACRARVSLMTVSNALNGRMNEVSRHKASRLCKIANAMGYAPNHAARSLRLGKTHEVVFVTAASLRYAHVHDLIEELQGALADRRYRLDLELWRRPSEGPALYRTLARGRCDGVILYGIHPEHHEAIESVRKRGMPVVAIHAPEEIGMDTVDFDSTESARLGTAHLLERGHTRVAIIVHNPGFVAEALRLRGYRRALEAAGLPFDESLIFACKVGADLAPLWQRITRSTPPPTGIVCYNAEMSAQLVGVIRRHGARIPEEMALVSLGDAHVNTLVEVPLTAVDTNPHGVAVAVVERLLERIAQPDTPPKQILVKPFLVVRESSGERRRP